MTLEPTKFNPAGNMKARHKELTIVVHVFEADASIIDTLIDAYNRTLPPKLVHILEQVHDAIAPLAKPVPIPHGPVVVREYEELE